jgi:hypothetical protein
MTGAALSFLRGLWSAVGLRGIAGAIAGWYLCSWWTVTPLQLDLAEARRGLSALQASVAQTDADYQRAARAEETRRIEVTERIATNAQAALDNLDRRHAADRARWLPRPASPAPGVPRPDIRPAEVSTPAVAGGDDAGQCGDRGLSEEDRRTLVEGRAMLEQEAAKRAALIEWVNRQARPP